MKKRIAAVFACIIFIASCGVVPSVSAESDYGFNVETTSKAVYFINLTTGEVLYEKNADNQLAPASTTKIMSAALAMEMCADLDGTVVTVPNGIWNEFSGLNVSNADLKPGEELTMHELIYCMLLQSANEAASTVAGYYGRDEFIAAMNDRAKELGCTGTFFSDPHGVTYMSNGGNYTTASDLAEIARWAVGVPGFWDISQQSRYDKRETNKNAAVTLTTTVLMQDRWSGGSYYTSYIKGIKTGTTDEAGRCLVTAAQKGGATYLLVVLGAPTDPDDRIWSGGNSAFTETKLIYDWAFENLSVNNVVDTATIVDDIKLRYANGRDTLLLYPDGELYTTVNVSDTEAPLVEYKCDLPDSINAPVTTGQIIGSAEVYYNGRLVGTTNLVSRETIELSRFVYIMDNISAVLSSKPAIIIYVILLLFAAIYLYFALVVMPRQQKRKRREALRTAQRQINSSGFSNTSGSRNGAVSSSQGKATMVYRAGATKNSARTGSVNHGSANGKNSSRSGGNGSTQSNKTTGSRAGDAGNTKSSKTADPRAGGAPGGQFGSGRSKNTASSPTATRPTSKKTAKKKKSKGSRYGDSNIKF